MITFIKELWFAIKMTENYYSMRKNCRCKELETVWNHVGTIDVLLNSADQHKDNQTCKLMLESAVDDYIGMVATLVFTGKVDIRQNDRAVPPGELHREDPFSVKNERYQLYCHSCNIEVPKIHIK